MAVVSLANNTAIRHISLFENQQFNLGTSSSTILKKISKEFLEAQERWRIRDLKRKRRVEQLNRQIDNCEDLDWREKNAAKLIAKNDGGYFKLETYIKFVNTVESHYKDSLVYEWEIIAVRSLDTICATGRHIHKFRMNIPVFWTQKDGQKQTFYPSKHSGISESCKHLVEPQKIHDRNNTIADFREESLSETRRGSRGHEKQPFHYYKTDEDFKQFIQRIEQEGLVKEPEPPRKEVCDFVGGFYYKVSFPKEKLGAERQYTKEELKAIRREQLSTLGGAEVQL